MVRFELLDAAADANRHRGRAVTAICELADGRKAAVECAIQPADLATTALLGGAVL